MILQDRDFVKTNNGKVYMVSGDILIGKNGFLYKEDYDGYFRFNRNGYERKDYTISKLYKVLGFGKGFDGIVEDIESDKESTCIIKVFDREGEI